MPAAEIRDHETGLVSGPFSWFQSRQLFLETHETEANSISKTFSRNVRLFHKSPVQNDRFQKHLEENTESEIILTLLMD